ncbi:MAG TPA: RES family NAD+ phosphorylase [Bryobacteraceae bacterium]|nr:RES family NAD+ phosphorylase [Bryobacteraceae bacterium]
MPRVVRIRWKNCCRLIPSRYPSSGILDRVASAKDLPYVFELESWTNDRISAEMGILHRLAEEEWVTGPQATVVMAAYCHPRPGGGRFNDSQRGAWYAARKLETAQAEIAHHRTLELAEIGVFDTRVQMRLYLADFAAGFHDVRNLSGVHDPTSYEASQRLSQRLLRGGSNGVVFRSVRHPGGECIACFRPKLVRNVRPDAYFEFRWEGSRTPSVVRLDSPR